jgi:hypothetical protein
MLPSSSDESIRRNDSFLQWLQAATPVSTNVIATLAYQAQLATYSSRGSVTAAPRDSVHEVRPSRTATKPCIKMYTAMLSVKFDQVDSN